MKRISYVWQVAAIKKYPSGYSSPISSLLKCIFPHSFVLTLDTPKPESGKHFTYLLTFLNRKKSNAIWTLCSIWNRIRPFSLGWKIETQMYEVYKRITYTECIMLSCSIQMKIYKYNIEYNLIIHKLSTNSVTYIICLLVRRFSPPSLMELHVPTETNSE